MTTTQQTTWTHEQIAAALAAVDTLIDEGVPSPDHHNVHLFTGVALVTDPRLEDYELRVHVDVEAASLQEARPLAEAQAYDFLRLYGWSRDEVDHAVVRLQPLRRCGRGVVWQFMRLGGRFERIVGWLDAYRFQNLPLARAQVDQLWTLAQMITNTVIRGCMPSVGVASNLTRDARFFEYGVDQWFVRGRNVVRRARGLDEVSSW